MEQLKLEEENTKKAKMLKRKNRVLSTHKNIRYFQSGDSKAVLTLTDKVFPKMKEGQEKIPANISENEFKLTELRERKMNSRNQFRLKRPLNKDSEGDMVIQNQDNGLFNGVMFSRYRVEQDEVFKKNISDRLFINPIVLADVVGGGTKNQKTSFDNFVKCHRARLKLEAILKELTKALKKRN